MLTAANVTQLLALTPPTGPWRKKLADAAVKWSTAGGCPTGDPALHHYLGEMYYKGGLKFLQQKSNASRLTALEAHDLYLTRHQQPRRNWTWR